MNMMTLLMAMLFSLSTYAELILPKTVEDFKRTSVMIISAEKKSGGTGSILHSDKKGSVILTNKHVCRLIEQGGFVVQERDEYEIKYYKKFKEHDLCLLTIQENLNVSLKLADKKIKVSEKVYVSGHPSLLPHILTEGHLSEKRIINLIVAIKTCSKRQTNEYPFVCAIYGGFPIVEPFESQVVSNLIKPGSSGSAVFNKKGELVGVVFAGMGRDFSHGYIVPQNYLNFFIKTVNLYDYVRVGSPVEADKYFDFRIFNYTACTKMRDKITPNTKEYQLYQNLCVEYINNMIWRK